MDTTTRAAKQKELDDLRARVAALESELELAEESDAGDWRKRYYLMYYVTTGFFLGAIGACTSLLFNVVGAALTGKHPLQLIKVYLTFGLGEKALAPEFDNGLALAIGCCLYIGTGMLLGVPFHVVLTRYAEKASLAGRLAIASALALGIWVLNFYVLLSWLQPLLFGGNWIVTEIPPWVAAATHLVFGWTMAVVYPWGLFTPYEVQNE